MIITPRNVVRHELIGLSAEVVESPNSSLVGLAGRIVDETKNTLLIDAKGCEKRIPKKKTEFVFVLPDRRRVKLSGSLLISQPEDRIHKKMRKARWKA